MKNTFNETNYSNNFKKEGSLMNTNNYNSFFNTPHTTDYNLVKIAGKVVNKYTPVDTVSVITIRTIEGENWDFVTVACYTQNNLTVRESVNEGDFVFITGHIQSTILGFDNTKFDIVCDSIITQDELHQDFFGEYPNKNRMYLSGDITFIKSFPEKNHHILYIRTIIDNKTSIFPIVYYNRTLPDINVNERASVIGNIQSVKRYSANGEKRYYENYVAFQIKREKCAELELSA